MTGKLPDDLTKLPANQNWDDVKKAIPPTVSATMRGPDVFFTDKPAELILFQGEPAYLKIPGTNVSYANNSENDVFLHSQENQIYYPDLGPLVPCQVVGRSLELCQLPTFRPTLPKSLTIIPDRTSSLQSLVPSRLKTLCCWPKSRRPRSLIGPRWKPRRR